MVFGARLYCHSVLTFYSPVSCAELNAVLDQFRSLKIQHLIHWSNPGSVKPQSESPAAEDSSDKISILSDFEEEQSVTNRPTSPVLSDNVQQLRDLLSHHVDSLLTASGSHIPLQERPLLTEVSVKLICYFVIFF